MQLVDLTGSLFGRLMVEGRAAAIDRRTRWNCRCLCGATLAVEAHALKTGRSKSCGCLRVEVARDGRLMEIAGKVFGRLTAIERVPAARGHRSWRCACECGATTVVTVNKLTSGYTSSCGCARVDRPRLGSASAREAGRIAANRRRARLYQAGGTFTEEQISELYLKQRGLCAGHGCGCALGADFHRDHRTPLARGGTNDILNIQLLCDTCNLRKRAKDPIDWAQEHGRLL